MIDQNLLDQMQNDLKHMKSPVRLILFTRDTGCEKCPEALSVARAIKARAPKLAFELYDQVMDRDKAQQYGVKQAPAMIVQAGNGRMVRFYGLIEDVFLRILIDTILAVSEGKVWFPENIRRTLAHLEKDVSIQIFVESDCPQCRPVAETGICHLRETGHADIITRFSDLIKNTRSNASPKPFSVPTSIWTTM
jgi:hypothetical protein